MNDSSQNTVRRSPKRSSLVVRQVERREWWLWAFASIVTVLLTAAIVFLASDEARSITGVDLLVDGGMRAALRANTVAAESAG